MNDQIWFVDPGIYVEGRRYRVQCYEERVHVTEFEDRNSFSLKREDWDVLRKKIVPLPEEEALVLSRKLLAAAKHNLYHELLMLGQERWTDQEIEIGFALAKDDDVQEVLEGALETLRT